MEQVTQLGRRPVVRVGERRDLYRERRRLDEATLLVGCVLGGVVGIACGIAAGAWLARTWPL